MIYKLGKIRIIKVWNSKIKAFLKWIIKNIEFAWNSSLKFTKALEKRIWWVRNDEKSINRFVIII